MNFVFVSLLNKPRRISLLSRFPPAKYSHLIETLYRQNSLIRSPTSEKVYRPQTPLQKKIKKKNLPAQATEMDRPNLPPLRLALSGSLDDFDRHQMHLISNEPTQARRHRNPTLLADLGPRLPPLIGHPPIRPGDLSIYSLGSSAGSASSAHGNSASSRNSIPFHEPTTNVHQPPRFPGVPDQARHHAGSFNVHPSSLGEVRHRRGSIGTLYNPSYHNLAFDQADRNQESGFRQLDNHHHAFPQSVRLSSSVGRVDQPISHRRPSFGMSGSPHVSPVCL